MRPVHRPAHAFIRGKLTGCELSTRYSRVRVQRTTNTLLNRISLKGVGLNGKEPNRQPPPAYVNGVEAGTVLLSLADGSMNATCHPTSTRVHSRTTNRPRRAPVSSTLATASRRVLRENTHAEFAALALRSLPLKRTKPPYEASSNGGFCDA